MFLRDGPTRISCFFFFFFFKRLRHCRVSSLTLQRARCVVTQIFHILFHREPKHLRYLQEHGHSEGMSADWTLRLSSHRGRASLDSPLSQNTCLTGSLAHRASAPAGWRHGVLLSSTVPGNILYPSLCPQLKEATICSPLALYTRQYHYREAAVVMYHSRDSVNVDISI